MEVIKKDKLEEDTIDERQALLDKLEILEKEKSLLDNKLRKHKDSNPVEYEQMKNNINVCN